MNSGTLTASHYQTGQPVELRWHDGIITSLKAPPSLPPERVWVAPGLVDLQVNGFAGVDFQQDDISLSDLLAATQALRRAGCTRILLTLVTDEWPHILRRLRRLRALRSTSKELQDAIAGWHVEGPFLSPEPGYCGAHDPGLMCDPTPQMIRELRAVTDCDPLLLTLAPERAGSLETISLAVSMGIKVSLGHTNASVETLRLAVARGATGFTHLGNACPRELDRHDNILWRVFEQPGLHVGLIADRIHVSPHFFRLAHRLLETKSLYYTTDAMAAAGAPPGRYQLGRLELEVGPDQVVRQPGRTNFAGSALRPIDGVLRAAEMLGAEWRAVWDHFSTIPAKWMGFLGALAPGAPANFCILWQGRNGAIEQIRVFSRGIEPAT